MLLFDNMLPDNMLLSENMFSVVLDNKVSVDK
jgi:hypothetical protein